MERKHLTHKFSYVSNAEPAYIDSLYREYLRNPDSVDYGWRKFFEGFEFARQTDGATRGVDESVLKEINVLNLIHAYRTRGHLFTRTNPVRERRKYHPTLDIENFNLNKSDLNTIFQAGREIGIGPAPLREIIEHLRQTYCHCIGAEYMFIREPERVRWLQQRMESTKNTPNFSKEEKLYILKRLNEAVIFENFLHTKYVGQKRFALSGGETLIPALDTLVERGAELGIKEFVIGMAHRGRLNILANILRKSYREIFAEFEGPEPEDCIFAGDVKYHMGYSSDVRTRRGEIIHLSLTPNPSHLEAVDPVAEGISRAKIQKRYQGDISKLVPILIHGDAAIAAQGVVYEVIQMSLLEGYRTGGTIHMVINNQVGFTTNYLDARSSTYCTDVAKVTLSPVFHVNADEVEAVIFTVQMALEYRQKFHTDVFIDLLGYRRYGHNEADEPRFTQPRLYKIIARHPDPRKIYQKKLTAEGILEEREGKRIEVHFKTKLAKELETARKTKLSNGLRFLEGDWKGFRLPRAEDFDRSPETGVDEKTLLEVGERVLSIPKDVKVFAKIRRLYDTEKRKLLEDRRLDWALGEYLAYGTLLREGVPVRISGQDSERGTFAHRHAVLLIEDTEEEYIPLNHISENQARFEIYNSLLSEYGVMGFEYGYAWANPQGLTIWEAQFGDFTNGGQIIIDQYLSSSQAKWYRKSGLVLYLPHGYEGQGPEHSSARVERFLTLCANYNWQLINCTTPANFFHVLRRQIKFPFRIPLIIFTPKSLLRHPLCVSPLKDFSAHGFSEVIDDPSANPGSVEKMLLCSGKIYYELQAYQQKERRDDVAIVRIEQLYPFPTKQLSALFDKYKRVKEYLWVQEEPENMGPLPFLMRTLRLVPFEYVARRESASPATGNYKQHLIEQQEIIIKAFGKPSKKSGKKSELKSQSTPQIKVA